MADRFQAPKHTSAIFTHAGEHRANGKGEISLPEDAPESVRAALKSAGCKPVEAAAPKAEKPRARRRGKAKKAAAKAPRAQSPAASGEPPAA
jgi:hypothetical protein